MSVSITADDSQKAICRFVFEDAEVARATPYPAVDEGMPNQALGPSHDSVLQCGLTSPNAVLVSFRSTPLRIPGYILSIATPDRTYHFGLNGWGRLWKGELPFRVRLEPGKVGYTRFSIAV